MNELHHVENYFRQNLIMPKHVFKELAKYFLI